MYWTGDHNEIGIVLISNALRLGLKDCGSLRKQARFLLESAVQKLGQIVEKTHTRKPNWYKLSFKYPEISRI